MKLLRPEASPVRFPAGLEPRAVFRPGPGAEWAVAIFHDRVMIRLTPDAVAEVPFAEIEAAGIGSFRVSYPGNPVEMTTATSRQVAALVLYLHESVPLAELTAALPSQVHWDPGRRNIWTLPRHALMIEWDGLEPSLAAALEFFPTPRAKDELELHASTVPAPPPPGNDGKDGAAIGGIVALAVILGMWMCGGPDKEKDKVLVESQKLRGRAVVERQGGSQIAWGARIWDRRGRQTFGCVGFEAKRLGRWERGRYCEPGGGESYVVWDEDRVGR